MTSCLQDFRAPKQRARGHAFRQWDWGFAMGMSIFKGVGRATVAAAAALACMSAQAAGQFADSRFSQSPSPVAEGQTVVVTWHDLGVSTGFDESTVLVLFDTSVFTLIDASAGSVFGAAAALTAPFAVDVAIGPGGSLLPAWQYGVSGNGAAGAAAGSDVFSVTLRLDHWAPGADTAVYFLDPVGPGMPSNYYSFDATGVAVAAVPEPATVASMLAGLALLAGVGARRRRAVSAAV